MSSTKKQNKFSPDNTLAIIMSECEMIYHVSNGEKINKFYVSIRAIVESTLKIIVYKNNPKVDPSRENLANLIIHLRLVPEFESYFIPFINKARKLGNKDAHAITDNIRFTVFRLELFSYLEWFFNSFLEQPIPDILTSWHLKNSLDERITRKSTVHNERRDSESTITENQVVLKNINSQEKREIPPVKEEEQALPMNQSNENNSSPILSNNKITSNKKTPYLARIEHEQNIASQLEKLRQERNIYEERKMREIDEERKMSVKLIKPITGDIITDFFMVKELSGFAEVNDNKIIIWKSTGCLIFDFDNHTISEKHIIKFKRTLHYKETINNYLNGIYDRNTMKICFISQNTYEGSSKKSYANFQIGKEVFKAIFFPDSSHNNFQNLYLLYCYILAYMSGIDIYKIVNIEDLRRAKWNDTPSINLRFLNEPDSLKESLKMATSKLSNDQWDKWDEIRLANIELKKLSFWDFKGIREMKNKISVLSREYSTISNNLYETAIRASRTSK